MATVTIAAIKEYILKRNNISDIIFSVDTQSTVTNDTLFIRNKHSLFESRPSSSSPKESYDRAMRHVLYGLHYLNKDCKIVIVARVDVEFNSYLKLEPLNENIVFIVVCTVQVHKITRAVGNCIENVSIE